ncbi:MAG TPA: BrxA/BrxB family bacilliredoxin [Gemmatimonadaceae bacterium]|nr:BrxA/BrxB family bacilliredoxin [Gemmatimonadaceae bacterium]
MTMYPEPMIAPMRAELTSIGFQELRTAADVEAAMQNPAGTTLLVVNSMCGCAARNARPGIARALQQGARPDRLLTVFAGQDGDATRQARTYLTGYAPSSPSMGLLKDGELVYMMERWQIEGRPADAIAADLQEAFEKYCGVTAS